MDIQTDDAVTRPKREHRKTKRELDEEISAKLANDPLRLLSKRELATLLGVNEWSLGNWRKRDASFPAPIILSPQVVRWRRIDIEQWLAQREAEPAKTRSPNAGDKAKRKK